MEIVKNNFICICDVDDTLVFSGAKYNMIESKIVKHRGKEYKRYLNEPLVDVIKRKKAEGYIFILWSRSGWEWVEDVVNTFNLKELFAFGSAKPLLCFDDVKPNDWLIHLDPGKI